MNSLYGRARTIVHALVVNQLTRRFFFAVVILVLGRLAFELFTGHFYWNFPVYTKGQALYSPWIMLHGLNKLGFLVGTLVVLLFSSFLYVRTSWRDTKSGSIRYFILSLIGVLTWVTVTFLYNPFFGQVYWMDRLTLVVTTALTVLHPAAIPFYLLIYLTFVAQLNLPVLGGAPLVNSHLVLLVLFAFVGYLTLRAFVDVDPIALVVAIVLIVGTNYFDAGLQKLLTASGPLAWPQEFSLELLFARVRFRGWATYLQPLTYETLNQFFSTWSPLLLWPVFVLELSALLLFFNQVTALVLLAGYAVFHVSFYIFSGVFYWLWGLLVVLVGTLLRGLSSDELRSLFKWRTGLAGCFTVLLLVFSGVVATRSYSWWTTRYQYDFRIQAVTHDGGAHELSRSNWGPYGPYFTLGYKYFGSFLVNEKLLPSSVSDRESRRTINEALRNPDRSLREVKMKYGVNRYEPRLVNRLEEFLRKVVSNQREPRTRWVDYLAALGPPAFMSSFDGSRTKTFAAILGKIRRIEVVFREGVFRGNRFQNTASRVVLTVPIY